ncbi:MAG: hydrogenase maturation nickel metallochaperone HypA, partial [Chloroflexota bacterium]|nr:hydrogenase maturation nickel metallochaperone HypA [Chloroflexota bacterium]
EAQARELGARRIHAINLVVGTRSGVVEDSLRFSFDMLAEGTLAAGAQINTRRTPMRFQCTGCSDGYTPAETDFCCPHCGIVGQVTDDGSALLIESIEIEA